MVEITDGKPADDLSDWDQVAECSVEMTPGRIVVAGCTDYFPDAARIDVPPGSYRTRVYFGNLNSLSADGLNGDDHYRVVMWSAAPGPILVLKPRAGVTPKESTTTPLSAFIWAAYSLQRLHCISVPFGGTCQGANVGGIRVAQT